jgi:hypothetical protein
MLQREGTMAVEEIGTEMFEAVATEGAITLQMIARPVTPRILLSAGNETHFIAKRP